MSLLSIKEIDKLLLDFIHLYFKLKYSPDKLNYYDKCLIQILDEYSFYPNLKKDLKSRSFND